MRLSGANRSLRATIHIVFIHKYISLYKILYPYRSVFRAGTCIQLDNARQQGSLVIWCEKYVLPQGSVFDLIAKSFFSVEIQNCNNIYPLVDIALNKKKQKKKQTLEHWWGFCRLVFYAELIFILMVVFARNIAVAIFLTNPWNLFLSLIASHCITVPKSN